MKNTQHVTDFFLLLAQRCLSCFSSHLVFVPYLFSLAVINPQCCRRDQTQDLFGQIIEQSSNRKGVFWLRGTSLIIRETNHNIRAKNVCFHFEHITK